MPSLRSLFRSRRNDAEIDRELQFHLDRQVADYVASGLSTAEARRRARLEFGGAQQIKEDIRSHAPFGWLETLWADLRYAARGLKRSPGFAAAAILALAFGSGGTTGLATVLNDLVARPPRIFRDAANLVVIGEVSPLDPSEPRDAAPVVYERWRKATTLQQVAAIRNLSLLIRIDRDVESAGGQAISPDLLDVLGAAPALGRGFSPGDDRPEAPPVAMLAFSFWQQRFAGDPTVVGRRIEIGGRSHEIIGVMPRGYALAWARDGLVLPLSPDRIGAPTGSELFVVGRRAPRTEIDRIRGELVALQRAAAEELPGRGPGWSVRVDAMRGRSGLGGRGMALVFPLLSAASLLTLIATAANLAILMVARGMARMKEAAVRAALGASRARLMQQVLLEALLLAAAGGALGLAVAVGSSRVLLAIASGAVPPDFEVHLDLAAFGFSGLVVVVAALACGAAPAFAAARTDVVDTLKGSITEGQRPRRFHGALVIVEMAVALIMLVCVGLFVNGYGRALNLDPGFEWSHLLTVRLDNSYLAREQGRLDAAVQRTVADRLRGIAGVTDATVASIIPPLRGGETGRFAIRGGAADAEQASARFAEVDARFFATIGLATLRGRTFDEVDPTLGEQAVISDAVARRFWPESDPLGSFIQAEGETRARQVVGVVADVQRNSAANPVPVPYIYISRSGLETAAPSRNDRYSETFVIVRTAAPPAAIAPQVRNAIREALPDRPMPAPISVEQMLRQAANEMLLAASLILPMVLLTLGLAAAGIYGLISQLVLMRRREIGIRAALGADRRQLLTLVLGDGLRLARAGVAAGLVGVIAVNRLVMSVFVGVGWARPSVVALCALFMAAVAMAASYRPASRAANVDPIAALRTE